MLVVDVLCCGALMLCWTRLCVALQLSHGQQQFPDQDPMTTGQTLNIVHEILSCGAVVQLVSVYTKCVCVFATSGFNHIVYEQCVFVLFSNSITGGHDGGGAAQTGDGSDSKIHTLLQAPCLVDDVFAALRESIGSDGGLTNASLTLFGICKVPSHSSGSVLLGLAEETNQRGGLELLHPAGGKHAL